VHASIGYPSVALTYPPAITAKPASCASKPAKRGRGKDMKLFYRADAGSSKFCFGSLWRALFDPILVFPPPKGFVLVY
jgi:hypothetical protein